jgi:hypothetical protein
MQHMIIINMRLSLHPKKTKQAAKNSGLLYVINFQT